MEQVVATINYLIREKLWCSIRKVCDLVKPSYQLIPLGNEKRGRTCPRVLEGIWHILGRQHHRGYPRTSQDIGKKRGLIWVCCCTHLLSWTMQKYWLRNNRHFDDNTWWKGANGIGQRSVGSSHIPLAHTVVQEGRTSCLEIAWQ